MNKNLLVADIGGTHARFHTFDDLTPGLQTEYASKEFTCFRELLKKGFDEHPDIFMKEKACFAVPGLVNGDQMKTTNLPWTINKEEIKREFGFKELHFLNDLQASAYGLQLLPDESFLTLQNQEAKKGNLAVLSPGTGLGEAFLTSEQIAYPTEGGHADFAPVTDLQFEMALFLKKTLGRLSYEHFLSGIGIWNIYTFFQNKFPQESSPFVDESHEKAKAIWTGAFKYHHHLCIETLRMFVQIIAQEAGNLALHTIAKKGLYIGGGIAPLILPYLQEVTFLDTFCQKGPMTPFLKSVPIKVILDLRSSLFGCAWYCSYGLR